MKWLSLFLIASLLVKSPAWAGRKVAVILDGGDDVSPSLSKLFTGSAEVLEKIYSAQNRGFEVIRLSSQRGQGVDSFKQTLAGLHGVQELELAIFAHGHPIPEGRRAGAPLSRFPISHLRPDEVSGQLFDFERLGNSLQFVYQMTPAELPSPAPSLRHPVEPYPDLGLGDLHEALSLVRAHNPGVRTTLSSLSCFGGNAIRALADLPDTQVFSATNSSQYYWVVNLGPKHTDPVVGLHPVVDADHCGSNPQCLSLMNSNSYVLALHQSLARGLSYLDAHFAAKRHYLEGQIVVQDFLRPEIRTESHAQDMLVRPESSFELAIRDFCLGAPPKMSFSDVDCGTEVPRFGEVENLGREVTWLSALEAAQADLSYENRHFERVKDLMDCDPELRKQQVAALHAAFQGALQKLKKATEELRPSDIARELAGLREEAQRLKAVRTVKDLEPWRYRLNGNMDDWMKLEEPEGIIRKNVETLLRGIDSQIQILSGPDAAEDLRKWVEDRKAEMSRVFKGCNSDQTKDLCYPTHLEALWSALDFRHGNGIQKADALIQGSCSIGKLQDRSPNWTSGLRAQQLQCLLDQTLADPVLRATAIARHLYPLFQTERARACQQVQESQLQNAKVRTCLSQPKTAADTDFSDRLRGLYLQGESTPRKK